MQEMRERILELLKDYPALEKKINLLRYEWEHPTQVTPEEVLDVMAFSKGEAGIRPAVGHISDKTYHIAVNYQDSAAYQNKNEIAEISLELEQLERKKYRLEHCVSQLPEEQAAVIRGLYFEAKGQKKLVAELHLSESTIQRYRDKALDALTDMYLTLQRAGVVLNW